jgi:hypothetical protein
VPAVVPAAVVQLAEVGLNVPVEFVVKLTDPVGVVGPLEVSVTVAVQLVAWLLTRDEGEHLTLVLVGCVTAAWVTVAP